MSEKLWLLAEVAAFARVPPRRILAACRKGELEFLDLSTGEGKRAKTRRFTQGAIERWLASKTNPVTSTEEPEDSLIIL